MLMNRLRTSYFRGIMVGLLPMLALIIMQIAAAKTAGLNEIPDTTGSEVATSYQWNIKDREQPLLGLNAPRLSVGFDQSLAFPANQFDLAISRNLTFDDESGKYLLPRLTKDKQIAFIEAFDPATANPRFNSSKEFHGAAVTNPEP